MNQQKKINDSIISYKKVNHLKVLMESKLELLKESEKRTKNTFLKSKIMMILFQFNLMR